MKMTMQLANGEAGRGAPRAHLWRLLLCSLIWAALSFGCVTVNYVTDVFYDADGHGARVSVELVYDEQVYAELLKIDPTLAGGYATSQEEFGWGVKESLNGRKYLLQRNFSSLSDLEQVPQFLAGKEGDASDSFIQQLSITTQEIDANTIEYTFRANVVITPREPEPAEGSDAEGGGSFFELAGDYPELVAALEQAGPAIVNVQIDLPGTISSVSRNNLPEGEVDGGRVRWSFRDDQPGTYTIQAVSRGPSAELAARQFEGIFSGVGEISDFIEAAELTEAERQAAELAVWDAVSELRLATGGDITQLEMTPKELVVAQAAFFAHFCQPSPVGKVCLMPTVERALPLIKRVARQTGDDLATAGALADLVNQLVEYDPRY